MPKPIPITLLKVLAEAASAYRTGGEVYVVASYEFPHDREVFYSYDGSLDPREEAERHLSSLQQSDEWGVFGPYLVPDETPASRVTALNYKVTVEGTDANGGKIHRIFDQEIDALFLTLPAQEKFLIPYYARLYGTEEAARMRATAAASVLPMAGHVWNTKTLPA